MTTSELFQIVDIHVQDSRGISVREMARLLPDYRLLSVRSYDFFGKPAAGLPPWLKKKERELIRRRAANGFHVAAAWQRARA